VKSYVFGQARKLPLAIPLLIEQLRTVSLSPIALVTATSVDKAGVAMHRQCPVKALALDAGSLSNFGDALGLGEVAQRQ